MMPDVTGRLMLLDTASLYFRAYFGVPESVKAPDGTPVNAVRGLLEFIDRLVKDHHPDLLVACMVLVRILIPVQVLALAQALIPVRALARGTTSTPRCRGARPV